VRFRIWGLLPSLSVTVTVPNRVPVAEGVKTTRMVHCPPGATLPPQVLVEVKSPLVTTLEMSSVALALLVSVADREWLLDVKSGVKTRGFGVSVTLVPVPLRLTICGLLESLSFMVSVPVLVPVAVGTKVTLIVQIFPDDTRVQLLV
jgi:hypothetical protein